MDRPVGAPAQPAPGSALDFLIAELLGDVGKVHVAIKELRDRLGDTEEKIRSAGMAAANTVMEATQLALTEMEQKKAQEDFRRIQAARVEAADLRATFMREAKNALLEMQATEGRHSRRLAIASTLVAIVSCLSGAAVGYLLANNLSTWTFISGS